MWTTAFLQTLSCSLATKWMWTWVSTGKHKQYAKIVAAKKAKKLEIADNAAASDALTPSEATMYQALSARRIYLSQDPPRNIRFLTGFTS